MPGQLGGAAVGAWRQRSPRRRRAAGPARRAADPRTRPRRAARAGTCSRARSRSTCRMCASSASRSAASSAVGGQVDDRGEDRRARTRRPATAATRTTSRASSERRSSRTSSRSASCQGSCALGVLLGRGDEFLGEERVAVGAADDAGQVVLGQRRAVRSRAPGVRTSSAPSGSICRRSTTGSRAHSRQRRAQRVAAVQVVAAVADDDREPLGAQPGEQEAEQVAGGLVGPVRRPRRRARAAVLAARSVSAPSTDCEQFAAVDAVVGVVRAAAAGQQPRDRGMRRGQLLDRLGLLGGQPGEGLAERQVRRRRVAEVDAVTDDRQHARARSALSFTSDSSRVLPTPASPPRPRRRSPGARRRGSSASSSVGEFVGASDERVDGAGHEDIFVPRSDICHAEIGDSSRPATSGAQRRVRRAPHCARGRPAGWPGWCAVRTNRSRR